MGFVNISRYTCLFLAAALTGCNGSSGENAVVPVTPGSGDGSVPTTSNITLAQRTDAVNATLAQNSLCSTKTLTAYYWEIGDASGVLASGQVDNPDPTVSQVSANTQLKIASASKWIFATYVLEHNYGTLSASDIQALTMKTGYHSFSYSACTSDLTVQTCFEAAKLVGNNNDFTAADVGKFYYNGGHFQKLAIDMGLGGLNDVGLAVEMLNYLPGVNFSFDRPQPAAGIMMSGAQYGYFLRKLLDRSFIMGDMLGDDAVCTKYNASTCPNVVDTVASSPAPVDWHYSLGHWVEDNADLFMNRTGDGAYSSPGAFGFYPWIDHNKQYYGLLAREDHSLGAYKDSAYCGRVMRDAWETGLVQP